MQDIKLTTEKIRRYGAERIAQYGRSRATLDATVCHHWAIICAQTAQGMDDESNVEEGKRRQ